MEAVAIVLLNYNGIGLLKRFIPQLVENSDQHPIYLIDNGSSDDSIDWVKNNYASIHCILLTENLGYAEGYNKGLKQIKASLYILLNTDVWVTKNWIAPMLDHFKSHPNTAIAQQKSDSERPSTHSNSNRPSTMYYRTMRILLVAFSQV